MRLWPVFTLAAPAFLLAACGGGTHHVAEITPVVSQRLSGPWVLDETESDDPEEVISAPRAEPWLLPFGGKVERELSEALAPSLSSGACPALLARSRMSDVSAAVQDFLSARHVAVAGVSRDPNQPANHIFRRLRDTGHLVWAVNPAAQEVEGAPCYPDLSAVPGPVDAVVIATPPSVAPDVVRDSVRAGVERIWMHRSFGEGSVSSEAVALCREHGVRVVVGGCPMMYCGSVDVAHRCMRWILEIRGRIHA